MGKALIIKGADFSANGIPADFTHLEWISSTNTSGKYINSDIFWGNKTYSLDDELQFCIKLDANKLTDSSSSCYSPGSYINVNTQCYAWFAQTSTKFYFAKGGYLAISGNLFDNNWHTISINKTKVTIDGTEYAWTDTPTKLSPADQGVYNNIPVYLDCTSRTSSNGYNIGVNGGDEDAAKIAWVKYLRSGSLILDAIPVKRKSDNKICFYDKISGEYKVRNDGSNPLYG